MSNNNLKMRTLDNKYKKNKKNILGFFQSRLDNHDC